ncbi:Auxin responsive protein [Musa troglodytarum]|uniref:Auxin responsive protein n=1 Tax=Musa troglodytarum TaxID=320322 RepID=A0A9E7EFC1_9LILI|nr:Auxin responsive protein [Musa troglodytarum]
MGRAENGKDKRSKGLILKTLERCRSLGSHRKGDQKRQRTPEGCFSVYVGPARERFVVRTECVNHPLFKMLLDEAELEFGYSAAGPLELPATLISSKGVVGGGAGRSGALLAQVQLQQGTRRVPLAEPGKGHDHGPCVDLEASMVTVRKPRQLDVLSFLFHMYDDQQRRLSRSFVLCVIGEKV